METGARFNPELDVANPGPHRIDTDVMGVSGGLVGTLGRGVSVQVPAPLKLFGGSP